MTKILLPNMQKQFVIHVQSKKIFYIRFKTLNMKIIQFLMKKQQQQRMQNSKYIIKKEFLDFHKYEELIQQTQIYENLFKNWLGQIAEYYKGPSKPTILMATAIDKNLGGFAEKLQNQLYPFVHSLNDISSQHLNFVSQIMRQSAFIPFQRDSETFIQLVKKLYETQTSFENSSRQLLSSENRLILHPTNNIEFYFFSNWFKRLNALQRYIKATKNLQQNKQNLNNVYKLSQEVEAQLLELRKKIMSFKYGYLKQGVKTARRMLNCLAEYLTIASQMMMKINGKLRMEMMNDLHGSGRAYLQNQMQQFQQNYASKAQQYRQIIVNLQNVFVYNINPIDPKILLSQFKQLYAGNQELVMEMFDVFNLFESVGIKRRLMHQRMNMIIKKIELDYKEKRKTAQILSTLNKKREDFNGYNSSHLKDSLLESGQAKLRRSQVFTKQIGLQNIERTISQSIEFAMETFRQMSKLCYKVTQKSTGLKKTSNNMSVSHEFKDIIITNKRPSRNQLWLWRDWRQFKTFEEVKPKYQQIFIQQQLRKVKKIMQKDQADLVAQCQIQGRHIGKADLSVFPQKLQLLSKKDNNVNIFLPIPQIQNIEPHKKKLILKMNGGSQLKLSSFKNISEVQSRINQFMMKKDSGKLANSTPAKPAISITPAELQAIKRKQPEMQALKQKMVDYEKFGQTILKGVTIQQVYDSLYSDKQSCPLSKNMSFSHYFNNKNKNINYTSTKFDKQGPYFYTGTNKEITFQNCPLISTRNIELDHPLPPIPFIPKNCHCKSQETIYWISNKYLEYKSYTYSYGAQMMETFYTGTLHKIKETDQGVHIQLYCKITFIKQTRMKSILYNGGIGEIKVLIPSMIQEMQKCMKAAIRQRNRQSKGGQGNFTTQNREDNKEQNAQVENSKGKQKDKVNINLYLVAFVIGTILINILVNLIF